MTNLSPAELDQLSKRQLIDLAKRGILKVMSDITLTEIVTMPKQDLPEYKRVAHLAGKPIHIGAASRKYHVASPVEAWIETLSFTEHMPYPVCRLPRGGVD
jgi:hypothetical protein